MLSSRVNSALQILQLSLEGELPVCLSAVSVQSHQVLLTSNICFDIPAGCVALRPGRDCDMTACNAW